MAKRTNNNATKNEAPAELIWTSSEQNVQIKTRLYDGTIYATLVLYDEITIYNCRIVEGKNGSFLSMPSYKGKGDSYWNYAYVDKDSDLAAEIQEVVDSIKY